MLHRVQKSSLQPLIGAQQHLQAGACSCMADIGAQAHQAYVMHRHIDQCTCRQHWLPAGSPGAS